MKKQLSECNERATEGNFLPPKLFFSNPNDWHPQANINQPMLTKIQFDAWWKTEIAPLFEGAVEVVGKLSEASNHLGEYKSTKFEFVDKPCCTHRALLINIRAIEEESAESILMEIINAQDCVQSHVNAVLKAKRFLERSDKNSLQRKAGK